MSVRTTTGGPLAVKKTRTIKPKKDAPPKAARPNKNTAPATKGASKSKSSSPVEPAQNTQAPAPKSGDELDKITTGFKKITLVTKQQKEARAKKESTASPPKPIASPPKIAATDDTKHTPLPPSSPDPIAAQQPDLPSETAVQDSLPQEIPLPRSGQDTPTGPPPEPQPATPDVFIQYQPEGPTPNIAAPQEPLTWLPPNTATPSVAKHAAPVVNTTPTPLKQADLASLRSPSPMKRADLPIFTPTSQIRFAPQTPTNSSPPKVKSERQLDDAIWEVPETPE